MISFILLAAGMSRRMGKANKLLLPLNAKPLFLNTLENILAAEPDEVVVVLGHEADLVKAELNQEQLKYAMNPAYESGMTSSIQAGVRAASELASGYLICLSDQPFIPTSVYQKIRKVFEEAASDMAIVRPIYQGKRGNPILFGRAYRDQILSHPEPNGCKGIVLAHLDKVIEVAIEEGDSQDIDTPEDYRRHK